MPAVIADPAPPKIASHAGGATVPAASVDAPATAFQVVLTNVLSPQADTKPPPALPQAPTAVTTELVAPQAILADAIASGPAGKPLTDAKSSKTGGQRPAPADAPPEAPTLALAPVQPGPTSPILSPPSPANDPPAAGSTSAKPSPTGPAIDAARPRVEKLPDQTAMVADKINVPPPLPDAIPQALPSAPSPSHTQAQETAPARASVGPPGAGPQTPTGQVGGAFVALARDADGTHRMTLVLQPPDLGAVRISIEQAKDSAARVSLTATNPATLLTLLRDQPALNAALDKAGIAGDGRVLMFHLAPPTDPAPVIAAPAGQTIGDAPQSFTMSGEPSPGGSGPGGRDGQDTPHRAERLGFADPAPVEPRHPLPSARQALTGIDIIA